MSSLIHANDWWAKTMRQLHTLRLPPPHGSGNGGTGSHTAPTRGSPRRTFLRTISLDVAAMVAAVGSQPPALAVVPSGEYLVGPGDVLKISVYRAPDLESMARVAGDGTIELGSIGRLKVDGLAPAGVASLVARQLKAEGIFVNPNVNVLVAEYHSKVVSVLGAVAHPGEYPLDRSDLTITEALARSGAMLDNGATRISIVAPGDAAARAESITLAELVAGHKDRVVRPGEAIFVQPAPMVYVSGEVAKPGSYPLEPGLTVQQAITLAGDVGPRGARSRVKVSRKLDGGAVAKPAKVRLTDAVQPGDQIMVGARIF